MTFTQSIRMCLGPDYFKFRGRASRSEFWWFALFMFAVEAGSMLLAPLLPMTLGAILIFVVPLILLPPNLGVTVRRFHDRNLSGWWLVIPILMYFLWVFNGPGSQFSSLISFAATLAYLAILCTPGQMTANKYGPPPADSLKI